MHKNGQTYFKYLVVWTLQDFKSMFGHYFTHESVKPTVLKMGTYFGPKKLISQFFKDELWSFKSHQATSELVYIL